VAEFVASVLVLGAIVFITSAASKLRSSAALGEFRAGLRTTALVPVRLLNAAALALAGAEAVTGIGMATAGIMFVASASSTTVALAEASLAAAAALMIVLTAGVAIVVRRGITTYCRCFGSNSTQALGASHLIRDLCLLLALGAGLVLGPAGHVKPSLAGWIVAVAAGSVVAAVFVRWEDLSYLIMPSPASQAARHDHNARS
jgi:hypothetical protein